MCVNAESDTLKRCFTLAPPKKSNVKKSPNK